MNEPIKSPDGMILYWIDGEVVGDCEHLLYCIHCQQQYELHLVTREDVERFLNPEAK